MQLDERPGGAPESEDIEDMMRGGVGVQRQVRSPPALPPHPERRWMGSAERRCFPRGALQRPPARIRPARH